VGRRALELDRDNAGAIHAVAHVLEMQDVPRRYRLAARHGAWLDPQRRLRPAPVVDLALYHLDLSDTNAALRILDRKLQRGVVRYIEARRCIGAALALQLRASTSQPAGVRW